MLLKGLDKSMCWQGDRPAAPQVELQWLGTAGFVVKLGGRTVVIDPYLSRPGLFKSVFMRLEPNEALIKKHIPECDEVLIGHAHHDHILDAPTVCHHTGARLIGSKSACNVGRAAGLPESQLVETEGDEDIPCGDRLTVRGIKSAHGRALFNRVPLPGSMPEPPQWPPRMWSLKHGQVFNWLLTAQTDTGPLSVVHIDSAEFFAEALEGVRADVLCLCAIGRRYRPNYVAEAVALLQPKVVIPCHWDWFFSAYDRPEKQLPGVDLAGFLKEIEAAGAAHALLPFGGIFAI